MNHYTVGMHCGKPMVFENGQPRLLTMYMPGNAFDNVARGDVDLFLEAGVRDFYLWVGRDEEEKDIYTNPFWPEVGKLGAPRFVAPDRFVSLSERITYIIERCSDARFLLRYYAHAPKKWKAAFPEEMGLDEDGAKQADTSLASLRYEADHRTALLHMVRWIEAQSWGWRVMGYLSLHEGEGTTKLASVGRLYDHSEPMIAAFGQAFPRWEGAIPRNRFDAERQGGGFSTWPEPSTTERERDYFELVRTLFYRRCQQFVQTVQIAVNGRQVLIGMDALKQGLQGWRSIPFFRGTAPRAHHGQKLLASGSIGADEIFQIPGFNVLNTPYDYAARFMGSAPEPEGIVDSCTRRGKLFLVEDDCRSFVASENESFGYFRNQAEVKAGLWRNAAAAIARGYQAYWMDVTSRPTPQGGYFRDAEIMETIRRIIPVMKMSMDWEHREVPGIAVILDDRASLEEDFSADFQALSVLTQRLAELGQAGVHYRIYLWEDLLSENFPDHRLFIFPNLFLMNEERLEILANRVCRDGRVVLWGPGTGITNGCQLGAEWASRVTGIPMTLVNECHSRRVVMTSFDHPITQPLRGPIAFGDSAPYGPILLPEWSETHSAQGVVLTAKGINRPGLVIKEMGEGADKWTSIFTAAVPVPAALIREMARYGGAHVYSEENDVILASRDFLAVHSVRGCRREIPLPRPSPVWDVVAGQQVAESASSIEMEISAPQTRLYYLGENGSDYFPGVNG